MSTELVPIINVRSSSGQHHSTLLDKNIDTVWVDTREKAWVELDLGAKRQFNSINIAFGEGLSRAYHFSVLAEGIPDDVNAKVVFDGHSKKTNALATYSLKDSDSQFIRIVIYGNDSSQPTKAQIAYVEVFNEVKQTSAVSATSSKLVARMTTPASANVNTVTILDGTRSEGDIKHYEFTYAGGPVGSKFSAKNAEGSIVEFTTPSTPGNIKLKLTVTDDKGKTDSDTDDMVVTGPVTPPPTHVCEDSNAHWDEAQKKCICNVGFHDENGKCIADASPPSGGEVLWDSNRDGKWNNGVKRTVKDKEGSQAVNGKGVYMAASGNPELVIDGDGTAHQHSSKFGRGYYLACNYNAALEGEFTFENQFVDDLSIKIRSNHQERPPNRQDAQNMGDVKGDAFGGYGGAISLTKWDSKREPEHNFHDTSSSDNLPKALKVGQRAKVRLAVKDEGKKVHWTLQLDYLDGRGYQMLMDRFDNNPLPFMVDKARYLKKSYFWIRVNAKGGMGSVALRNWQLVAI